MKKSVASVFLPMHLKEFPFAGTRRGYTCVRIENGKLKGLYQLTKNIYANREHTLSAKHMLVYFFILETARKAIKNKRKTKLRISLRRLKKFIGYDSSEFVGAIPIEKYLEDLIHDLCEYSITVRVSGNGEYSTDNAILYRIEPASTYEKTNMKTVSFQEKRKRFVKLNGETYARKSIGRYITDENGRYIRDLRLFPISGFKLIRSKKSGEQFFIFDLDEFRRQFDDSDSLLRSYYCNARYEWGYPLSRELFSSAYMQRLYLRIKMLAAMKTRQKTTSLDLLFKYVHQSFRYRALSKTSSQAMRSKYRKELLHALINMVGQNAIVLDLFEDSGGQISNGRLERQGGKFAWNNKTLSKKSVAKKTQGGTLRFKFIIRNNDVFNNLKIKRSFI